MFKEKQTPEEREVSHTLIDELYRKLVDSVNEVCVTYQKKYNLSFIMETEVALFLFNKYTTDQLDEHKRSGEFQHSMSKLFNNMEAMIAKDKGEIQ